MAITGFPNDAICYILADIPGEGEFQGTGAIIGPHTILTAAHLLYEADGNATADKVSVYPGFTPDHGTYNPPGALPGLQSIHTIKVNDSGDRISAQDTQSDFAVIDTSTDLSSYGEFALDPNYTSGEVVVTGYPASSDGYLTGTGGTVMQDGSLSDIRTSSLALSPGYSGGPIRTDLYRDNGDVIPAVAGTVSTNIDGMKLNQAKVRLIRHWIASDRSLYAGGSDAPRGLIPQLDGTVTGTVDAASVTAPAALPAFTYTDAGLVIPAAAFAAMPALDRSTSDLAAALHDTSGAGDTQVVPSASDGGVTLAAPVVPFHPDR